MAIETHEDGTLIYTGPHIKAYQLVVVKTRIKLDALLGAPQATKSAWARKFGLSPRTKAEVVIAKINEEIDRIMHEHPATPILVDEEK